MLPNRGSNLAIIKSNIVFEFGSILLSLSSDISTKLITNKFHLDSHYFSLDNLYYSDCPSI